MQTIAEAMREEVAKLRSMPNPFEGVPEVAPLVVYACENCEDKGMYFVGGEKGHMEYCLCDAGYRLMYGPRLPAECRYWTLENWPGYWASGLQAPCDPAAAWLRKGTAAAWLRKGTWMLITGPVGTGKTSLAISLHKAFCYDHGAMRSLFWVVADLLATVKESFGTEGGHDPRPAAIESPLLVLDDLGRENMAAVPQNEAQRLGSTFDRDEIQKIVQAKYSNGTRLIVTTNMSTTELLAAFDKRVSDRLFSKATVVRLSGKSLRKKGEAT